MNGDQKLDVYDQAREKFLQHFPQIVKVLTEDDVKCTDAEDAVARLREVRGVQSEGVNLRSLLYVWDPAVVLGEPGTGVGAGFYLSDSRSAVEGPVPSFLAGHPNCFAWAEALGLKFLKL